MIALLRYKDINGRIYGYALADNTSLEETEVTADQATAFVLANPRAEVIDLYDEFDSNIYGG